jgi:hypothetical protein
VLLAWADGAVNEQAIAPLSASEAKHLVLFFNPIERGAVLEAM